MFWLYMIPFLHHLCQKKSVWLEFLGARFFHVIFKGLEKNLCCLWFDFSITCVITRFVSLAKFPVGQCFHVIFKGLEKNLCCFWFDFSMTCVITWFVSLAKFPVWQGFFMSSSKVWRKIYAAYGSISQSPVSSHGLFLWLNFLWGKFFSCHLQRSGEKSMLVMFPLLQDKQGCSVERACCFIGCKDPVPGSISPR